MKKKTLKRAGTSRSQGHHGHHQRNESDHEDGLQTDLKSVLDELSAGNNARHVNQWMPVQCPYCGENFDVHVDVTEDETTLQEDCQICCRPIEVNVHIEDGRVEINAYRS